MSEEENKPKTFTDSVKPPEDYNPVVSTVEIVDPTKEASDRIMANLADEMVVITQDNIKKLAPLDKFTIGNKDYDRKKITPANLRKLRKAEQAFREEVKGVNDIDLISDKEFSLNQIKAEVYLGMSKEDFEETDYEYLQQVLQATELRTQGFRRR